MITTFAQVSRPQAHNQDQLLVSGKTSDCHQDSMIMVLMITTLAQVSRPQDHKQDQLLVSSKTSDCHRPARLNVDGHDGGQRITSLAQILNPQPGSAVCLRQDQWLPPVARTALHGFPLVPSRSHSTTTSLIGLLRNTQIHRKAQKYAWKYKWCFLYEFWRIDQFW